jgi:hypothetical protein
MVWTLISASALALLVPSHLLVVGKDAFDGWISSGKLEEVSPAMEKVTILVLI